MLINITLQFFNEIMHCMTLCSFFIFAFLKKMRMNEKPIMKNAKGFNTVYTYSLKGNPRYGLDFNTLEGFSNRETT